MINLQQAKSGLKPVVRYLNRIEDALLAGLLTAMLILACVQILARNLFQWGFVWGDPAVRAMVLWIGLIGAMVAVRQNKHIAIDLLYRHLPRALKRPVSGVLNLFAAAVCGVVAYFSLKFVHLEYLDGMMAFSGVPVWVLESIIPLAFGVMAVRYMLKLADLIFRGES